MPDFALYLQDTSSGGYLFKLTKTAQYRPRNRAMIAMPFDRETSGKAVSQVTQIDFVASLAECTTATEIYLREAEKTSVMLGKCGRQPLTFEERLALLSQEIQERDAFRIYLDAKRFLHSAALRGYDTLSTG
jgi:hypothetical protein